VPKITAKFELDYPPPLLEQQMQVGGLKSATFDEKRTITRKRVLLIKSNRIWYAPYRMAVLLIILGDL